MAARATNLHGCPLVSVTASLSVGQRGNLLLQDTNLIEHLAQFDRERIPERVVHAKGAAAFGQFEVTHDITRYTKAKIFNRIGKVTPLAARFSTVGGESGSADTARDPRGFAVKMYTEDGNWDLVGNNTPIFFIRDPILFPSFIHTQKRHPQTHLKDPNMFWDFISLRPETTNQVTFLFSDRGTPDGFRHMDGFGSHTFKLVNAENEAVYCKFHWITDQGLKNLSAEDAARLQGENPDYALQDLYEAINRGEFPSWTLYIQVMTFAEAEAYRWNPFDVTKRWLVSDVPLQPVGRMILNRNALNYFAETEQLAFAPANMVPGIEASPDKMLQGRLFSYVDTQRHRLGANFPQLPVNRPLAPLRTYTRDGPMSYDNQAGAPNYFPNSFGGPVLEGWSQSVFPLTGDVIRHDSGDEDNFTQVDVFWQQELLPDERQRTVNNIAGHLKNAVEVIRNRVLANFYLVNEEFGSMLEAALETYTEKEKVQKKRKCPVSSGQAVKKTSKH
jgi:catalase